MPEHSDVPLGESHRVANWEYADTTARLAATGFLASDVGKWAKQLDDGSYWELTDDSPITWAQRTGGSIGGSTGPTDNRVLRADGTGGATAQPSNLSIPDDAATTEVGYMNLPQNSQSANYTTVLADRAGHLYHPLSDDNPRTFTIPANSSVAYAIGTALTFINDQNTLTIAITTDTLVWAEDGSSGSRTLAENGIATAIKVTSTRWIISGVGLS
jgi:hypothetical protein